MPKLKWQPIVKGNTASSKVYTPYENTCCAFIDKHGNIRLSDAAMKVIESPEYVEFMSDGNGNLGIKASQDGPNAYLLSADRRNHKRIACRKISVDHKICPADGVLMYSVIWDEDDNLLILNTKQKATRIK